MRLPRFALMRSTSLWRKETRITVLALAWLGMTFGIMYLLRHYLHVAPDWGLLVFFGGYYVLVWVWSMCDAAGKTPRRKTTILP